MTARIVLQLHPSSRDGAPNAWMVEGFDARGDKTFADSGNTALDALHRAIGPAIPAGPPNPNAAIVAAIGKALEEVTEFHFAAEGILLFVDSQRVGTINWRAANKRAFDALCGMNIQVS